LNAADGTSGGGQVRGIPRTKNGQFDGKGKRGKRGDWEGFQKKAPDPSSVKENRGIVQRVLTTERRGAKRMQGQKAGGGKKRERRAGPCAPRGDNRQFLSCPHGYEEKVS